MRTLFRYSLKIKIYIFIQYFFSKLSLFYFYHIKDRRITFVTKGGIGDAIYCTAALEEFRKKLPNTRITVATRHPLIFKNNDAINHLKYKYGIRDFPLVWLNYGHFDFSIIRQGRSQHITKIITELIGIKSEEIPRIKLKFREEENPEFFNMYIKDKIYIVIQPYSGGWFPERDWKDSKWNELIARIRSDFSLIYQVGLPQDTLFDEVYDLRGKTDLAESALLIKHAICFIGVNSFGEQVAGAYDIPSLIIHGPTNPFYSLNERALAVFGQQYCMNTEELEGFQYKFYRTDDVSPEFAYSCFRKLLKKTYMKP